MTSFGQKLTKWRVSAKQWWRDATIKIETILQSFSFLWWRVSANFHDAMFKHDDAAIVQIETVLQLLMSASTSRLSSRHSSRLGSHSLSSAVAFRSWSAKLWRRKKIRTFLQFSWRLSARIPSRHSAGAPSRLALPLGSAFGLSLLITAFMTSFGQNFRRDELTNATS